MPMLFLVDESVNRSVSTVLRSNGYEVRHAVDVLGQGAPDPYVVRVANELRAIVVDANAKHFQQLIARRKDLTSRSRFAGRLSLRCNPARAADRMKLLLDFVRLEWEYRQGCRDTRVIIDVYDDRVTISR